MKRQETENKEWLGGRHEEAQTIGGGVVLVQERGPAPPAGREE